MRDVVIPVERGQDGRYSVDDETEKMVYVEAIPEIHLLVQHIMQDLNFQDLNSMSHLYRPLTDQITKTHLTSTPVRNRTNTQMVTRVGYEIALFRRAHDGLYLEKRGR